MTLLANVLNKRTETLLQDTYQDFKRSVHIAYLPIDGATSCKQLPFLVHFTGNKILLRPLSPHLNFWSIVPSSSGQNTANSPSTSIATPLSDKDFLIELYDDQYSLGSIEVIDILGLECSNTISETMCILCTDSVDLLFFKIPLTKFLVEVLEMEVQSATKIPSISVQSIGHAKPIYNVIVQKVSFLMDQNDILHKLTRHKLDFQDFSRLRCLQAGYMIGYNRRTQSCVIISPSLRPHSEVQHALVHYKAIKEPDLILTDQTSLKIASDQSVINVKQNSFVFCVHKRYAAVEIFTLYYKDKTLRLRVHAEESGSIVENEFSYLYSIYPVSLLSEQSPALKLGERKLIASALGITILDSEMSTKTQKTYHFCVVYGMNFLVLNDDTEHSTLSINSSNNSSFDSTITDDSRAGTTIGNASTQTQTKGKTAPVIGQPPRPERQHHDGRKNSTSINQQPELKTPSTQNTVLSGPLFGASITAGLRTDMVKVDHRVFRRNNVFCYIGKKLVGAYNAGFIPSVLAVSADSKYLFIASTESSEIHVCELSHNKTFSKIFLKCKQKISTPSRANVAAITTTPIWVIVTTIESTIFTFRYRDIISQDPTNMLIAGLQKMESDHGDIPPSLKNQLHPIDLLCDTHFGGFYMPHLPSRDVSSIAVTPNTAESSALSARPMETGLEVQISNILEPEPPIINLSVVNIDIDTNRNSDQSQASITRLELEDTKLTDSEAAAVSDTQVDRVLKLELDDLYKEKDESRNKNATLNDIQSADYKKENNLTDLPDTISDILSIQNLDKSSSELRLDLLSNYGTNQYCFSDSLKNIVNQIVNINLLPSNSPDIAPLDIGNLKINSFIDKTLVDIECKLIDRILNSQIRSSGRPRDFYLGVEVRILERLFKYCINFYASFVLIELWCYYITSYDGKVPGYYLTTMLNTHSACQDTSHGSLLYTFEVSINKDAEKLCKMLEVCVLPSPDKGFIEELTRKTNASEDIYGTIRQENTPNVVTSIKVGRNSEEFKFHQINFVMKLLSSLFQKFLKDMATDIIDKSFNCEFNLKLLQEVIEEASQFIVKFEPSKRLAELQNLFEDQLAKVFVRTISVQSYFLRTSTFARTICFAEHADLVDLSLILEKLVPSTYSDWDLLSKIYFLDSRIKTMLNGMHSVANMQSEAIQNLILQLNDNQGQQLHASYNQSALFSSLTTSRFSGHSMVAGSRIILSSQLLASHQNNTLHLPCNYQSSYMVDHPLTLSDVNHTLNERPTTASGERTQRRIPMQDTTKHSEEFVNDLDGFENITDRIPVLDPQRFVGTTLVSPEKFAGFRAEKEDVMQLKSPIMPAGRSITDSLLMSLSNAQQRGQRMSKPSTSHAASKSMACIPHVTEGALLLSNLTRSGSALGPVRKPCLDNLEASVEKEFVAVAPAMVLTANQSIASIMDSTLNPPVSIEQRIRKLLFEKNVDLSHLTYHSESENSDDEAGPQMYKLSRHGNNSPRQEQASIGNRSLHNSGSIKTESSISLEDMLTYSLVEKMNTKEKMKLVETIAQNTHATIEDVNGLILQAMNEIDAYYASNRFLENIRDAANAIPPNSDLANLILLGTINPEKLTAEEATHSTLEELVKSRSTELVHEARAPGAATPADSTRSKGGMFTRLISTIRGTFGRRTRAIFATESQGKSLILSQSQPRKNTCNTDRVAHTLGISGL